MKATIVIPTYKGEAKIERLLKSLSKQTVRDLEVIVVVDGVVDRTAEIVNSFIGPFHSLKVIEQANQGRSVTKNNGAKAASAEILIFYDDDMEPGPDSVERHILFHQLHKGLLTGNPVERESAAKTDIQNYKAYLTVQWTKKYPPGLSRLTSENLFFAAANCSIPKALFQSLGGFDENLKDAEDYDLARRAIGQGIPVYYDKSNEAIHHDPITFKSYLERQVQYKRAHQELQGDYQLLAERNHSLKHLMYFVFTLPIFVWAIEHNKVEYMLPRKMRYKLYSLVIHALTVEYPSIKIG